MFWKTRIGGLAMATAMTIGMGTAHSQELAFAVFVPAASPTVTQVYEPWAEWFNEGGEEDGVTVRIYAGGTLGRDPFAQARMVADGVADLAITVPSYTPGVYPDFDIFELPGFAMSTREGSLAALEMHQEGQLGGYEDFYMVALYTSDSYMLHSSSPIESYDDIEGKSFRVAGQIQTAVIEALGGVPRDMSAVEMAENIDRGLIDGAVADASVARTFRVTDVAKNHYAANLGVLVFAIVMNKDTYEGLPDSAKERLAESGQFIANRQIESYGRAIENNLAEWEASDEHNLVRPSEEDEARIAEAVGPVIEMVAESASEGLLEAFEQKLEEIRNRE